MNTQTQTAAPYRGLTGVWIYNSKPEGLRLATKNDFFDQRGAERTGFSFLVHTYKSDNYEAHTARVGSYKKFKEWIEDGRAYVKQ